MNSVAFEARAVHSHSPRSLVRVSIALGNSENAADDLLSRDWGHIGGVVSSLPDVCIQVFCGRVLDTGRFVALLGSILDQCPGLEAKIDAKHDPEVFDSRELAPDSFGSGWGNWDVEIVESITSRV